MISAPATTANVGPGFDCAAIALELRNELEVTAAHELEVVVEGEGADEVAADESNLVVRAYALLADPRGKRFRCVNRIPLGRGLGSSAAAIALGLRAAAPGVPAEELLAAGLELEGHADNLAAALAGGCCLTWAGRIARVADDAPLAAIAVVPEERVSTDAARRSLPAEVAHADAAHTAGRAALLGAALAAGDSELFAAALDDRLHEPYRAATAPLLAAIRSDLPPGAVGATISGSGPTVVVWARPEEADACAAALAGRLPRERVLRLAVAAAGAG